MSQYRFRRANVDDVERLHELWERHDFDTIPLEQRLIEFQVAVDEYDEIHAAIGIRLNQRQALFHHECWSAEMTPQLRRELAAHALVVAERMQAWRIWILQDDVHWAEMGFDSVPPDHRENLPQGFGDWKADWKALKLKPDIASDENLARQFELLRIQSSESNEKLEKTGKLMKVLSYFLVAAIGVSVLIAALLYFQKTR